MVGSWLERGWWMVGKWLSRSSEEWMNCDWEMAGYGWSTDAPISEIAETLSFQSQAYFARFFRKETGTSPTSYRATAKS